MEIGRPKVLLIKEDRARFGHVSNLIEQLGSGDSELSVDTLVVDWRNRDLRGIEDQVDLHLRQTRYKLVLVPDEMPPIVALKRHSVNVAQYGVNPPLKPDGKLHRYVDLSNTLAEGNQVLSGVKAQIETVM